MVTKEYSEFLKKSEARRKRFIALLGKGVHQSEIARILGVSRQRVSKLRKILESQGRI